LSCSLKKFNTFNLKSHTDKLYAINQISDIEKLINHEDLTCQPFLIIGAGSNLVLLDKAPAIVIKMQLGGITFRKFENNKVIATVGAGVQWHQVVEKSLQEGFYGLENLALIPGLVGAAPIQNIGAYGVEICERFISLTAIDLRSGEEKRFLKQDCNFAYRDSYFKHQEGRYFLVTSVQLQLSSTPNIEIKYKALAELYESAENVTPQDIFNTVCSIRRSKLPDPKVLGNAGSFFKNPIIGDAQKVKLQEQYPDLVTYPLMNGNWKVAAGWMIDKVGLKGFTNGQVGVHKNQALVLVNYGDATGTEVLELAKTIQRKCLDIFSIKLETEVSIIGEFGSVTLSENFLPEYSLSKNLLSKKSIINQLSFTIADEIEIDLFAEIDSTNSYLLSQNSSSMPQICVANIQTMGRGRHGRKWYSAEQSNIYFSQAFHLQTENIELSGFSLVIGVMLTELLQKYCSNKLSVKWPNDVLSDNKKLAGILIEINKQATGEQATEKKHVWKVVVGIGINVSLEKNITEIDQPYTSLTACNLVKDLDRNVLVAELIDAMQLAYNHFTHTGLDLEFIKRWNDLDLRYSQTIELVSGEHHVHGIHRGIDKTGKLLIEEDGLDGKRSTVKGWNSGEVRLSK